MSSFDKHTYSALLAAFDLEPPAYPISSPSPIVEEFSTTMDEGATGIRQPFPRPPGSPDVEDHDPSH